MATGAIPSVGDDEQHRRLVVPRKIDNIDIDAGASAWLARQAAGLRGRVLKL